MELSALNVNVSELLDQTVSYFMGSGSSRFNSAVPLVAPSPLAHLASPPALLAPPPSLLGLPAPLEASGFGPRHSQGFAPVRQENQGFAVVQESQGFTSPQERRGFPPQLEHQGFGHLPPASFGAPPPATFGLELPVGPQDTPVFGLPRPELARVLGVEEGMEVSLASSSRQGYRARH